MDNLWDWKPPIASKTECIIAEAKGTLIWSDEFCRIYRHEGTLYVLEPLQEQETMLDPQDPFRHEVPDCGYGPRDTDWPKDPAAPEVATCDDESCAGCDKEDALERDLTNEEVLERAIMDALLTDQGNVIFVSAEDLAAMFDAEGPEDELTVDPIPPLDFLNPSLEYQRVRGDFLGPENQERIVEDMRVSDVSGYEIQRRYIYPDGEVVINDPWRVFIAPSGSHRVQQLNGNVNYIPPGWKVLQWTPANVDDPVKF